MKNIVVFLGIVGCTSNQVNLYGDAKSPGDPSVFVSLCQQGDVTAIALKEATKGADCATAGKVLANVAVVDFNQSGLESVNLNTLTMLTNIERLEAYGKGITDVTPLAGLVRMERLYLMQNKIVDISPLASMSQLKHIRLDGNQIEDISPLSKLRNLEKIGLDSNKISDFRPLAELPYITDLNTNFNPVDLDKCPDGKGVAARLVKYCKKMKKGEAELQDGLDPKQ